MTKKFEKIANKYSSPVLAVQIKGKWYKNSIKMFKCTLPLMFHCLPSTVCRDELFPLQMLPTSDAYRLYAPLYFSKCNQYIHSTVRFYKA